MVLRVSVIGLVWAWSYGGEGKLALGLRILMVSSPLLVPFIDSLYYGEEQHWFEESFRRTPTF